MSSILIVSPSAEENRSPTCFSLLIFFQRELVLLTRVPAIVLGMLLLCSCAKEQVVDNIIFPDIATKTAVYCVLTPSDSIYASIKSLEKISSQTKDSTESVENAQVTIENLETKKQITLKYKGYNGLYAQSQADFPIIPGTPYRLTVIAKGRATLQASCLVPNKEAIIKDIAYGEAYADGFTSRRRVTLTWQNNKECSKCGYGLLYQFAFKISANNQISSGTRLIIEDGFTSTNDRFFYNGSIIDSNLPQSYQLLTMDSNLYSFYKMADAMKESARRGGTNDFFGSYQGIIPESTNIENGLGVFGSFLKSQRDIIVK